MKRKKRGEGREEKKERRYLFQESVNNGLSISHATSHAISNSIH
jgi:hypothetical protein